MNVLYADQFVKMVEKKIVEYEEDIDLNQAIALYQIGKKDFELIKNLANNITQRYFKNAVELCSIYPAKVGMCPEDCKFCSQSMMLKRFF